MWSCEENILALCRGYGDIGGHYFCSSASVIIFIMYQATIYWHAVVSRTFEGIQLPTLAWSAGQRASVVDFYVLPCVPVAVEASGELQSTSH